MSTWTRWAVGGVVGSAILSGGACVSGEGAFHPELADVVFEGGATAEALAEMVEVPATENLRHGPVITFPPNNSVLHSGEIVTFTWGHAATAAREGAAGGEWLGAAGGKWFGAAARSGVAAWLGEVLGAERSAHAAGAEAMSGRGYFLVFTTLTGSRLLRVFTMETSYTPDEDAWKTLSAAGIWTELRVSSALFLGDSLLGGTGPFEGEHIEFCIERE